MGHIHISYNSMMLLLILLFFLSPSLVHSSQNDLTCSTCVGIVTAIDDWITSDKTEQEILDFFNQICLAVDQLIPGLGENCTNFLQNNGPSIIDSIVHEKLDPMETCTLLTACP